MNTCPDQPEDSEPDMGSYDARDVDPRYESTGAAVATKPRKDTNHKKPEEGFTLGAFFVLADHVPILLDLNFAAALADHILTHGSDNRAILAFGHQLQKASGD